MKTLILNGSPRKNGDTAQLLELAKAQLQEHITLFLPIRQIFIPVLIAVTARNNSVVSLQTKWKQFIRT